MNEIVKAAGAYATTAVLAALAQRYHLTADQVTAITMDAGAVAAAVAGVYMHKLAADKEPKK